MKITVDGGWTDSVGDGWKSLVEPLIERANAEGAKILQVKEKFGELRFYVGGASPGLQQDIDDAELKSTHTCEYCGATDGVTTSAGERFWLKTLCPDCHRKRA